MPILEQVAIPRDHSSLETYGLVAGQEISFMRYVFAWEVGAVLFESITFSVCSQGRSET